MRQFSQKIRESAKEKNFKHSSQYSAHLEIISENVYNLEQIKQLYLLGNRFPTVTKEIRFIDCPFREIAENLQIFLNELFNKKVHY